MPCGQQRKAFVDKIFVDNADFRGDEFFHQLSVTAGHDDLGVGVQLVGNQFDETAAERSVPIEQAAQNAVLGSFTDHGFRGLDGDFGQKRGL